MLTLDIIKFAANIRMQRNPDGSAYVPRRVTARSKKGRIKRQMFTKLRTTKYLKTAASVQFAGQVQRIAQVHHFGLREWITFNSTMVKYTARKLLGFNGKLKDEIKNILIGFFDG